MWHSDMIPIVTAALTGGFLLTGYVVQKAFEHSRAVAEKRCQAYSMFIKSRFAAIGSRQSKQDFDLSEEVFSKAQVSLYGSDEVIRKLGHLETLLPRNAEAPLSSEASQLQVAAAFDELVLAMRRDIVPKTRANLQDLRRSSPLLMDRTPDAQPTRIHPLE